MSLLISIHTSKGGQGKSLVSLLLAGALSQPPFNLRVFVADLDEPQHSLKNGQNIDLRRYDAPAPYQVEKYNYKDFVNALPSLDAYDIVFLDLPGRIDYDRRPESQEIGLLLSLCNFIFVPFTGGAFNFTATHKYYFWLKQMEAGRSKVTAFINQFQPRSIAGKNLLSDLKATGISPVMVNRLNSFSLFHNDADSYTSFYDPATTDPAKHNFTLFVNEFVTILNG